LRHASQPIGCGEPAGDNVGVTELPLRERLVEAGVVLLEEDGLGNLTLRAIARRAGVSHGAPRRYFPTHNALLAAIAATGLRDLAERLRTDPPSNPASPGTTTVPGTTTLLGTTAGSGVMAGRGVTAEGQLVGAALRYLEFAAERPGMFELLFRHDLLAGAGENLRETSLPLLQTFVDLVAQVRPMDVEARATALWTNIHGLATLRATNALGLLGTADLTPLVHHVVRVHIS
jgi:AcrR family transcriptional regulator